MEKEVKEKDVQENNLYAKKRMSICTSVWRTKKSQWDKWGRVVIRIHDIRGKWRGENWGDQEKSSRTGRVNAPLALF